MGIAGCTASADPDDQSATSPDAIPTASGTVLLDDEVQPLLEVVPERSLSAATMPRLAEGLVPPTNQWFSGMVFGDEPMAVFPLPLSFQLTEAGFTFGVPTVTSTQNLIMGALAEHMSVETDATSALITRYDEVSVTTTLFAAADEPLAEVTIARGSAVVSYRALADHDVTVGVPLESVEGAEGVWSATVQDRQYGLVASGATLGEDGSTLTVAEGSSANWVAVPDGAELDDVVPLATSPITGVTVAYGVDADATSTTLTYVTEDGSDTLVGALPHHRGTPDDDIAPADCALGSMLTTYGEQSLCAATELSFTAPAVAPVDALELSSLDLSGLSDENRAELVETLRLEAGNLPDLAADTYFGGKGLARIATLISLARELEHPEVADSLQTELVEKLRTWIEPAGCEERDDRCFVYDPEMRGITGLVPSFGSEDFNDHHFHYGSFLYAAAIAAQGDEALVEEFRPMMSLLAADIASSGGESFPTRRAFDPYSGHSWASGISPFGDGNNQESSSEAVAAHHALTLWGAVSGDEDLEEQARWMLSLEALTARSYWTGFDTSAEPYADFDRSVVGILWDGKRDYATWFSPEPAAILGIQLLPMRPGTAASLAGDGERILANIEEATASGPAPQFADYLLMYQAIAGPDQAALALEEARELPTDSIDDGNSRSYLLAWIMAQL